MKVAFALGALLAFCIVSLIWLAGLPSSPYYITLLRMPTGCTLYNSAFKSILP